jgi:LuxR family transcriptional regulator, quorum-sensing system regulator BjaR1
MVMQASAFGQSLDQTVKFIHDLDRARTVEEISAQLVRHLSQIGAEHVIAGAFPADEPNRRRQLSHSIFGNYPREWVERYLARHYILKDPVILRAKMNADPFFFDWSELAPFTDADAEVRRIAAEAREFHLVQGFSGAMQTLDGQIIGFTFAGRHFESDPDRRGVLTLIASYAIGRAIALHQESPEQAKEIRLSAREREALQWAAEGKNDWEIGEIMKISEHGADKHMRSARLKLGAINRTQAVAEAIRRGFIV